MYLADIVAAVIVLVFVLIGVHNGLVKSVLGLSSIVISLILALVLYPVVSDFLSKSVIGTYVTENVQNVIGGEVTEPDTAEKKDQNLNLPDSIMQTVNDSVSQVTNSVTNAISGSVASLAINLISILAVFLIVRLLVWLLASVLDVVTKLPVIHTCNKLLGGALGGLSGIIVVYLLLALLTFSTALNAANPLVGPVQDSVVVSQMYNNNFLLHFLDK